MLPAADGCPTTALHAPFLSHSNPANTCFANSLLQCLLATPPLAAFLVSRRHSSACKASGWCMVCELEKLSLQVYSHAGGGGAISPKPLLQHIKKIGRQFTFGRQEDAHELFVYLLDALERSELEQAGGWQRFDAPSRTTCVVGHCFNTWLRGQVECLASSHVSKAYEPHVGLALDVTHRTPSLEAALAAFTAPERLEGANCYQCDACGRKVAAERRTLLEAAPNFLQITLKRYGVGCCWGIKLLGLLVGAWGWLVGWLAGLPFDGCLPGHGLHGCVPCCWGIGQG